MLRSEQDHKAALVAQKVPVAYYSLTDEHSLSYMKYLTLYAYHFVAKQMELKEKVQLQEKEDDTFESASSKGLITVTSSTYECTSWMSMKLPCRHILAARSKLGLELYDKSLCAERWSAAYYKLNQRIFICEDMPDDSPLEITQLSSPKKRALSQVLKFACTCV